MTTPQEKTCLNGTRYETFSRLAFPCWAVHMKIPHRTHQLVLAATLLFVTLKHSFSLTCKIICMQLNNCLLLPIMHGKKLHVSFISVDVNSCSSLQCFPEIMEKEDTIIISAYITNTIYKFNCVLKTRMTRENCYRLTSAIKNMSQYPTTVMKNLL